MAQSQVRQRARAGTGATAAALPAPTAMLRVDALRSYSAVVAGLGADPDTLLAKAQIDPEILATRHAFIPYRAFAHLLERTAAELKRPDFGMRLAARQGIKVGGPLEVAMRNAPTMREAYRYCIDHIQAFSTGSRLGLDEAHGPGEVFVGVEILAPRLPMAQVVEHGLLLLSSSVAELSGGLIRAREIWLSHQPVSDLSVYGANFDAPVRFGQVRSGIVYGDEDFNLAIPGGDPELFELATSFIARRFPASEPILSTRVRSTIERLLLAGDCTYGGVAAQLAMHPRTLQRRLRAEGESFEALKDGVRRDVALRYLQQPGVPMIRVAQMLGYSETSVLARSCNRWFSASPKQVRAGAAGREKLSLHATGPF